MPPSWIVEPLDVVEHVGPRRIVRAYTLAAVRSVLSEEKKLSIAAFSQTFRARYSEH